MTFPNCGDTFVISLRPLDYEAYTMIVFISSSVCFSLRYLMVVILILILGDRVYLTIR